MVTAVNDVRKASEAIQRGARDYLIKPFDVEAIIRMTERILRRKALARESDLLTGQARPQLIGRSEKIESVIQQAKKLAAGDTRVLIEGEPGTEKEEIARLIHENSPRRELPFKSFYLSSALPAETTRARLYGRESGRTTAELKKESGLLDEVRGGTLFLSRIEQLKGKPPATAARLIGATDRSDLAAVNREIFDHFAEAVLTIPPLRARLGDLPVLVERYLAQFNRQHGRRISRTAPAALEIMAAYHWPGNTMELRLMIERAVLKAAEEEIAVHDLPLDLLLKNGKAHGRDYPALFEKSYIKKLREVSGLDRAGLAAVLQVKASYLE
jgi:two-component system response regulator HydG